AEAEFISSQPDWMPLEFTVVPWIENDALRCQLELGLARNTNAMQQAETIIPPGGTMLWGISVATNAKCQLVLLRQHKSQTNAQRPEAVAAVDTSSDPRASVNSTLQKLRANSLAQNARRLYETGKLDEAEGQLKEALTKDPENKAAYYYLDMIKES